MISSKISNLFNSIAKTTNTVDKAAKEETGNIQPEPANPEPVSIKPSKAEPAKVGMSSIKTRFAATGKSAERKSGSWGGSGLWEALSAQLTTGQAEPAVRTKESVLKEITEGAENIGSKHDIERLAKQMNRAEYDFRNRSRDDLREFIRIKNESVEKILTFIADNPQDMKGTCTYIKNNGQGVKSDKIIVRLSSQTKLTIFVGKAAQGKEGLAALTELIMSDSPAFAETIDYTQIDSDPDSISPETLAEITENGGPLSDFFEGHDWLKEQVEKHEPADPDSIRALTGIYQDALDHFGHSIFSGAVEREDGRIASISDIIREDYEDLIRRAWEITKRQT